MPRPARPPLEVYAERLEARQRSVAALDRRHARLAAVRLALFGAGVVLAVAAARNAISGWWLLVPAVAFIGVAAWHDRVLESLARCRRAVAFYERGLARITDRWAGTGAEGAQFADPSHLYAADLDLFGNGSLFQLLSTARLAAGEATLASWLLAPAPPAEIRARQVAVSELRDRLDLRERLALVGAEITDWLDTSMLAAWGAQPPLLPRTGWPRVVAALLAATNVATLIAGLAYGASAGWFLLSLALSVAFTARWRDRVRRVLAAANAPARALHLLGSVLAFVESEQFIAPRLKLLHERLAATGDTASHRISRLRAIVDLLQSRQNQFFAPIAALLLWGTQMAWAIEDWRRRSGAHLGEWLAVVGEFEALCSLAGYAYEHPADPFPEIVEPQPGEPPLFAAEDLAHPLIPADRVVVNSVRLGGETRVLLVSGSNMSGKSTLLRTVGINVVLAQAGAPVRARSLRCSPLAVGATLRIQDSLQEGRSRFYAEITRLRTIVDLTTGDRPVLFLLDELLAGTNSHDRRLGAAAVLRGLVDRGAIGLVTTHDLALAEVAAEIGAHAKNVHFSDEFVAGEIRFDYKMRPGVVQTSNALALMRAVGLDVPELDQVGSGPIGSDQV